jgi:3'(2'), 5'-bisphosphate nucleotidase
MTYERELQAALTAARLAGVYISREYELFVPIPDAPVTISTHVDRQSQDLILESLARTFPEDAFVAEEATEMSQKCRQDGPRRWIIDPIDGTRGFARKNGQFSVMIGLTLNDAPVVGVVYEPVTDVMTYATHHGGCFVKRGDQPASRCQVSDRSDLAQSIIVKSHTKPGMTAPEVAALAPAGLIVTYSAGIKLAVVARGEADLYPNDYSRFSDWDICAGHILVTEAGGQVTQLRGEPIRYNAPGHVQTGGLLASNGRLHASAIERLASMG